MSAHIVDTGAIEALVTLAWRGPKDQERPYPGARWATIHVRDPRTGAVVQPKPDTMQALAHELWRENHNSVNALRGRDELAQRLTWGYLPERVTPTAVEGLKLVAYYRYQTCEHDGWATSFAHEFCDTLEQHLIHTLPGWEDAPWGWRHTTQESHD